VRCQRARVRPTGAAGGAFEEIVKGKRAMMFSIRRVRQDEGEMVIAIWRRAVDATHHFLTSADKQDIEREVRAFLPQAPLWVAVTPQDRPVAFMLLSEDHLDALFVDPELRGCGVGRLLVKHALALIPSLTTDVNEQNAQAAGFYKKMGFVVTGRSPVDDCGRPYPLLQLRYRGA